MVVKNDVRYRIDTLLRMASITTNEAKRNEYLLTIEELLSDGDTQKIDTFEVPFGDEIKMKVVKSFVDDYKECNISGKFTQQVYEAYTEFCNDIKSEPLPKVSFSKYLRKVTGVYPVQKRVGKKNLRVYMNEK